MKQIIIRISIFCGFFSLMAGSAIAQLSDTSDGPEEIIKPAVEEFKPAGKLWGYAFGDYAYKGHSDSVGSGATLYSKGRGGANQYTNMPPNTSMFQFRRIYFGYNYDISPRFSSEFVVAAEDNFNSGLVNQGTGDILSNGKFAPYVKIANIKWKNLWKG